MEFVAYHIITLLLNGLIALFLGIYVLWKNKKDARHLTYFLLSLSIFIWAFLSFIHELFITDPKQSLFITRLILLGPIFMYSFFIHYIFALLEIVKKWKKWLITSYVTSFFFALFAFSPWLVKKVEPTFGFNFWPKAGLLFHFYLIVFFFFFTLGFIVLFKACRGTSGIKQKQLKLFLIGGLIGAIGGSTNYFFWYNIPIPAYGNILVSFYLIIFAYILLKYGLMNITPSVVSDAILSTMSDSLIMSDAEMKIVKVNQATLNLLGYNRKELIGQFWKKIISSKSGVFQCEANNQNKEIIYLSKNLEEIPIHLSLSSMKNKRGKCLAVVGIGRDMRKTKEYIKRLKELNRKIKEIEGKKLEDLVQSAEIGIIIINQKKEIILTNPAARQIMKKKEEKITLDDLNNLFPKINFREKIEDCFQLKKTNITQEIPENGAYEFSFIPIGRFEKKADGAAIMIRDITKEKELEKKRREFISIASHQLRTPLSALKWVLKMFIDGDLGKINKEQKEYLIKGFETNERMIKLINDLLNISRLEEGKIKYNFKKVDSGELIKQTLKIFFPLFKEKKIKVKINIPSLPPLQVDQEKIMIAVQNLLNNALLYTREGEVKITAKLQDKDILFSIQDTGIGVPSHQLNRLFTKFFRGENVAQTTSGSGLGLYIAQKIIEAHKGRIWAESRENKGSVFFFTLPLIK